MNGHPSGSFDPSELPESQKSSRSPAGTRRRLLPLYKLILHSGSVTDMMFIVRTVMELTRLCRAEATHKMWEAHHYGHSQLLVTFKERAELYIEQFAQRGLTITLEPL